MEQAGLLIYLTVTKRISFFPATGFAPGKLPVKQAFPVFIVTVMKRIGIAAIVYLSISYVKNICFCL
ncbi:hypothetical protein FLA_4248 [Filimonas lacunae]|nr:hypothetical protein FLA_4248 [Filimonas lacunae]